MDRAVELTVPCRVEYIAVVRLIVASLAGARRHLADDRIDDLKLAVSEACTNAIEATWATGEDSPVIVTLWEAPERMEVCVADHGGGFNPDALSQHPAPTDPERLNFERGLGIPLIRSLVDTVRFEPRPSGTAVWLTLFGGPSGDGGDETSEILRVVLSDDDR